MIRDHFAHRTNAPQPQMLIAGMIWLIALFCLFDGTRPKWAWCMIGVAALDSVYVALLFRQYYAARQKH